ncbi:MAG: GNAT family N-acetyltransferase [Dermatophilaceae bacterium]
MRVCAEETARLTGQRVRAEMHTRLFELTEVVAPSPVLGSLRRATAADVDLALSWYDAFMTDADEQAGRPRGASAHPDVDRAGMLRRLEGGRIWLWTNEIGRPVHLTALGPPSFGCVRLGSVYIPPEERGRGYASAAVAALSQRVLDGGATPCLFTDQANPTSNAIYQRLGYRPLVDMANLVIGMPGDEHPAYLQTD